jgi:hypothetical protein
MADDPTSGFAIVSGCISLLVALINGAAPAVTKILVRKFAPDSQTIGDIAVNSASTVAEGLRNTLAILSTSMATIQGTASANAAKIDEVLVHVRPSSSEPGGGEST